jgi:hypothetical protein
VVKVIGTAKAGVGSMNGNADKLQIASEANLSDGRLLSREP